ncbi:hypothetical protein NB640_10225 [Oxalobacter vibrioformis]|uniref:Uncharacterized protein n=1 Tax=Oxalobacter vibrioformis TaxID=933080 RepID=A0A9E9P278_9BURK|nr:hypothetical protein [Oxalobacter vibrioformis]WAW09599.1 hypothetical protein NB640_10225 [Oxalobacter vibrioformis]
MSARQERALFFLPAWVRALRHRLSTRYFPPGRFFKAVCRMGTSEAVPMPPAPQGYLTPRSGVTSLLKSAIAL